MSDRRDYFFRQLVSEVELDDGFEGLEEADRHAAQDWSLAASGVDADNGGIFNGLVVTAPGGVSAQVTQGVAYDDLGQRCATKSVLTVDLSMTGETPVGLGGTPVGGVSTDPGTGNRRWVSLFLKFARDLQDPRTDGTGATVYFERLESFVFVVEKGLPAPTPTDLPPLQNQHTLLADVRITDAGTIDLISTARRQNWFRRTTGGAPTSRVGAGYPVRGIDSGAGVRDVLSSLLGYYNDHTNGTADQHAAGTIPFTGTGTWADGSGLAALEVAGAINEVVDDLAATAGAARVGAADVGPWHDATYVSPATKATQNMLAGIVSALASEGTPSPPTPSGVHKIGALAQTSGGESVLAGSLFSQISQILTAIGLKGPLAGANTWTGGSNTFQQWVELGTALLGSGANALVPRLRTSLSVGNLTLLWSIPTAGGTVIRVFGWGITSPQQTALVLSLNAGWNGTAWVPDNTTIPALRMMLTPDSTEGSKLQFKDAPLPASWSSWDSLPLRVIQKAAAVPALVQSYDGAFQVINPTTGGSNPPAGVTLLSNTLYASLIPKAWGHLALSAGTVTQYQGPGYISVYDTGNNRLQFTLTRQMANVNWRAYLQTNAPVWGANWRAFRIQVQNDQVAYAWGYNEKGEQRSPAEYTGDLSFLAFGEHN